MESMQEVRGYQRKTPIKRVKSKDLIFPLDKKSFMWSIKKISSIVNRWMVRRSCAILLNSPCSYYQMGGYTGTLKKSYELVDTPTESIVHWLLREVGYSCSIADIMKRTGREETEKIDMSKVPRMVLVPEHLAPQGRDAEVPPGHCKALI